MKTLVDGLLNGESTQIYQGLEEVSFPQIFTNKNVLKIYVTLDIDFSTSEEKIDVEKSAQPVVEKPDNGIFFTFLLNRKFYQN